jgi:hypothetical protein
LELTLLVAKSNLLKKVQNKIQLSTMFNEFKDDSLLVPVRYQVDETCCREALIKERSQAVDTGILPHFVASKGMLQLGYRVQYSTQVFDIIEKSLELADDKNDVLNEIERAMFFQDAFYFAKIGMD